MSRACPPWLAARLAGMCAPPSERDALIGDLEERFVCRARSRGRARAGRWYWGQAIGLAVALLPRRIASAFRSMVAPGTVRSAVRSLVRSPISSLVATGTLAIGIAAPTTMFGLLSGITGSLPGDPEDRVVLVNLFERETGTTVAVPWHVFEAWREQATGPARALSSIAAFQSDAGVSVGGGDAYASRYKGLYATSELFRILGVTPIAGRIYGEDELNDGIPAMLIRADVWEERFDRDPGVIGQTLRVDGERHVIVGVLPEDFGFPNDYVVWMEPSIGSDPNWSVLGELHGDGTPTVAMEQLASIVAALPKLERSTSDVPLVRVEAFTKAYWGKTDEEIAMLVRISILLMVVAAASVASIMLARGVVRMNETAVRLALGGTRGQVMAHLILEVVILAACGAALGLLVGYGALQALVRNVATYAVVIPYWMNFGIGWPSVLLALTLSFLAVIVSGGIPALRASNVNLESALRSGANAGHKGSVRLMRFIVGVEVTLSSTLLMVTGVAIETAILSQDRGIEFTADGVLTGRLALEEFDYPTEEDRRELATRFLDAVRAHPSVTQASLSTVLPGMAGSSRRVGLAEAPGGVAVAPRAQVRVVDPGFFSMFGLDVSIGRILSASDAGESERVAVVNEAFVRQRLTQGEALGRLIEVELTAGTPYTARIVGVVEDPGVTPFSQGRASPGVYLTLSQYLPRGISVMSTTKAGTSGLQVWNQSLATIDPNLPIGQVLTMNEVLSRAQSNSRRNNFIGGTFGVLALLLSLVGLNGVHAFLMERRTREIGIRRALGADSARVLRENLLRGLRPVWIGLALGLGAGILLLRVMVGNTLGPELSPVLSYILTPTIVIAASVLAIWSPTRGASRADPLEALKGG